MLVQRNLQLHLIFQLFRIFFLMATVMTGVKRGHEEVAAADYGGSDNRSPPPKYNGRHQDSDEPNAKRSRQQAKPKASKVVSKRGTESILEQQPEAVLQESERAPKDAALSEAISLQIVTGSYDRGILHGITATIPSNTLERSGTKERPDGDVKFSDTFLFGAHASSIRCLGISGASESGKRTLATGGSDERINLYTLSTATPPTSSRSTQSGEPSLPSLVPSQSSSQNPKNRSLGYLVHHDRPITRLHFPPNSNKLFSSSEDNNIAITRTRDWTLLSSIRAPIPKPTGRPSGDTAGPGEVPAGVNDFAVHPSQKLMLSVGRGERCLRLWNLMTGKKAGVLNFDREVLVQVGEGKYSSGEGRRVLWSEDGEFYVVVFERGAVVYGLDSKARAVIKPTPPTKLHQVKMLPKSAHSGREVLAISTEDGRVLFFDLQSLPDAAGEMNAQKSELPTCHCIAQLGGRTEGISGRIKDFEILSLPQATEKMDSTPFFLVVTASSDGAIRIWSMPERDLEPLSDSNGTAVEEGAPVKTGKRIGSLVGMLETGNRITCLGAFVMDGKLAANGEDVDDDIKGENVVEVENGVEGEIDEEESEDESWDGFEKE